ncbi:MAG: DUF2089 domain-containing protein [Candidatus Izemoplasmatales bacterium]|nr:DUF2089 domain-containing protein [Candidatus Izemoplasmatales bacterium]MDD4070295.1 DUF2089 domain-containing protein [Candidatus Izemoplasmatales bacterium]MDY0138541.1 DUF2089 domain-containing protein [Candidatus Izemoplasmatales bacterium]
MKFDFKDDLKKSIEDEMRKSMNFKGSKGNQKKYPVISECPVCHHDLEVVQLVCSNCSTEIKGKFTLSKFNYLDTEKLYFIEVFVKNRGNIKAIEKEMGYSYPTIKKMLDEVIEGLGYSLDNKEVTEEEASSPDEKQMSRIEILDKIDKGEITVEEATKLLSKIK